MRNLNEIRDFVLKISTTGFRVNFNNLGEFSASKLFFTGTNGTRYCNTHFMRDGLFVRRISDGKIVDLAIN